MGYRSRDIDKLNETMGHPVNVVPSVEPDQMLQEYKKHEWLVYTASRDPGTVGWSLAVAEAQAAGVGVCFPRLRPDLNEYVGSAGYLYDSIDEVAEIINKPFPEEKRRRGFEHARRSDVARHKELLITLWRRAATGDRLVPEVKTARSNDGLPDWCEADTRLERKARFRRSARELASVVPKGGLVIVAGDISEWGEPDLLPDRRVLPFVERDGQFWGQPADDDTAVAELERMRPSGRSAIVFTAANFWWLDYYRGFADHLRTNYARAAENAEMVVFDLGQRLAQPIESGIGRV